MAKSNPAASLWHRVQGATRVLMGQAKPMTTADLVKEIAESRRTASGVYVGEANALCIPAVYGCVRIISQALAKCPFMVYRLEERKGHLARIPVRDHPASLLLNVEPNRYRMAPFTLKQMMVAHILLRGNSYTFVRRSGNKLVELIPLHPDRMALDDVFEPGPSGELGVIYHYSWARGGSQYFRNEEILHLRGVCLDGVMGVSLLDSAREAMGLAIQQERFAAKLFANGASPSGVVKYQGHFDDEAFERFRKRWRDLYSGADNAHKVVILEDGMDWTPMAWNAEETQFYDGRKFQRSEIAMYFGVPPHMLGDVDKATSWGSGIEQQAIGFVQHTIDPWGEVVGQQMTVSLLTEAERSNHMIACDLRGLIRGDLQSRATAYKILREIEAMNPNEIRAELGMNPREDEGGDDYGVPVKRVDQKPQTQGEAKNAPTALISRRPEALPRP
ncbi:phage portal protein [Rhodomicrobium lacus]|uniref:phage portal protein n=1 Tax=Rhodomicrobium lacus TaxID=2498452 RepID=UPI000F8E561F|nr:phage portal protein [Rhodomicrobium lacus]